MVMSEEEEARLHDEVVLMWTRNIGKSYIIDRIFKRMLKCIWGNDYEKSVARTLQ